MIKLLKNYTCLCLIILATSSLSAQTNVDIEALNQKAKELYDKGMYKEAAAVYSNVLDVNSNDTLDRSDLYESYHILGNVFRKKGEYGKSAHFHSAAIIHIGALFGGTSIEFAGVLNDFALLCIEIGRLKDIEGLFITARDIRLKKLGKDHPDYAESLSNLGHIYMLQGKLNDAKEMLNSAYDILEKGGHRQTPQYATSLYNLAYYYSYLVDPKRADKLVTEVLKYNEKKYGKRHPDYAYALALLAYLRNGEGKYKEAGDVLTEALSIYKEYYNENNPNYIGAYCNLGISYQAAGDYDRAVPVLKRSLELIEENLGKEHIFYISAANALGILYASKGKYSDAEPLFLESLEIREKMFTDGPYVVNALGSLANFYVMLNNHTLAEEHLLKALDVAGDDVSIEPFMVTIYTQLGAVYIGKWLRDQSLYYYEKALDLHKKYKGADHPYYYSILNQYAAVVASDPNPENNAKAEKMYIDVCNWYKRRYGVVNTGYFLTLNNLATFYHSRGKLDKAWKLYEEGLEIVDKVYIEDDQGYVGFITNVGNIYDDLGDYKNATKYYARSFKLKKKHIEQNFAYLSEKERKMLWDAQEVSIEVLKKVALKYLDKEPALSTLAYNAELFSKGLLLNSSNNIQLAIAETGNELLINLWDNVLTYKSAVAVCDDLVSMLDKQIAAEFALTLDPRLMYIMQYIIMDGTNEELKKEYEDVVKMKRELARMENDAFLDEKYVIEETKALYPLTTDISIEWDDVRKMLEKNEIAIEFVNFSEVNIEKLEKEAPTYCALVLRSDSEYPEMVYLCNEPELRAAIKQSGYDSEEVYPIVWKPLEKYLAGIDNIYIAPSGLLNSVAFGGMKIGDNYLSDKYIVHNVLSTRDIESSKERSKQVLNNKTALLVGGADYEISGSELAQIDKESEVSFKINLTRSILDEFDATRGQGFNYLPGSKKEVQVIHNRLKSLDWNTTLLLDKNATETQMKNLLKTFSPELLHVSTHGFYFSQGNISTLHNDALTSIARTSYSISDNPLMRSGLALTGANYVWNGNEIENNMDDGILTAYEVSNMNLMNTKLVVLSACDTGLGDVVGSEGVYGLQRAFRLAGVQSMLVTLWKVPDAETVELMNDFYTNWTGGSTIKMALQDAQTKMRHKYPDNPEKWAGFVLIE